MKAVRIEQLDGPGGLMIGDVAAPTPGAQEIRVQVKATALNRADLLQTMGLYPAPAGVPADIPGIEYAGVVESVGPGVTRWRPGDRVMGLVGGGAWAEQLVTHALEAIPIPADLSFEQAAAVPEAFITAFDALTLQGGMRAGNTVLIHAIGSGVGTAGLQWAKVMGAKVIGTARTASKLERCRPLGLDVAILVDSAQPKFAAEVKADVALDLVGGHYFPETIDAMAHGGTILLVGLTAGITAEVNLRTILAQRIRIIGTTLRSRTLAQKIAVAEAFTQQVLPHLAAKGVRPVVGSVVPLVEIQDALNRLAANETFGKVVVTL